MKCFQLAGVQKSQFSYQARLMYRSSGRQNSRQHAAAVPIGDQLQQRVQEIRLAVGQEDHVLQARRSSQPCPPPRPSRQLTSSPCSRASSR